MAFGRAIAPPEAAAAGAGQTAPTASSPHEGPPCADGPARSSTPGPGGRGRDSEGSVRLPGLGKHVPAGCPTGYYRPGQPHERGQWHGVTHRSKTAGGSLSASAAAGATGGAAEDAGGAAAIGPTSAAWTGTAPQRWGSRLPNVQPRRRESRPASGLPRGSSAAAGTRASRPLQGPTSGASADLCLPARDGARGRAAGAPAVPQLPPSRDSGNIADASRALSPASIGQLRLEAQPWSLSAGRDPPRECPTPQPLALERP